MLANHSSPGRHVLRAVLALLTLTAAMTALAPATSAMAGPRRADLTVTATISPTEVSTAGGRANFFVNVSNTGTVAADNVTATITVPPGTTLAGDGIPAAYWQCDVSTTPTWTCTHAWSLAPGEQAETIATGLLFPPGTDGSTATVGVTVATTSRELSTRNNTAQASVRYVTPQPPDLAVGMRIVPTEVIAGGMIYFQIDVRNIGAGSVQYFRVDLPVPANVDPVSPSTGSEGWDCTFGRDVETGIRYWGCTHGVLAAGAAANTLVLLGRVTSGAPGDTVSFTATAPPAELEENTSNNAASASVAVVQPGTVRGTVWSDVDANGQRGTGEGGVSSGYYGVQRLVLIPQAPAEGDPSEIEVDVDSNGVYAVALKPGPYIVQVWVEINYYDFTTPNVGDDATDSDIVTVTSDTYRDIGSSAVIDVVSGADITVDAGLVYTT